MKVFKTVPEIQNYLTKFKETPLGFVPTMGALHDGHISLVEKAVEQCPVIVISIFVNPTQFNDKNDLLRYPRSEENDHKILQKSLRISDAVFIPRTEEIYPVEDKRVFDLGNLDKVMEGIHRPGHFNGVAQVVTRLFGIINPDYAYFGQKDFQQLTIIKYLVAQLGLNVKIVGCPIVREPDGLAMSSRNMFLDPGLRENASIIYRTIKMAAEMAVEREISEIRSFVEASINNTRELTLDYFEIVDDKQLIPITRSKQLDRQNRYFCCVAVRAGNIRLIDNVEISL